MPCFLCFHYLAKLGPIEKEAAVFGQQLSSSHEARELSSLLSTSVASWLKTQRDASLFSSPNMFSSKSRSDPVLKSLLQTRETPGLFITPSPFLGLEGVLFSNAYHMPWPNTYYIVAQVFTIGEKKWLMWSHRFIKVSRWDLNPEFSPKLIFFATILAPCKLWDASSSKETEPEHCQKAPLPSIFAF